MECGISRREALEESVAWLKMLGAARSRVRAGELLGEMQANHLGTAACWGREAGASFRSMQQKLIRQANGVGK